MSILDHFRSTVKSEKGVAHQDDAPFLAVSDLSVKYDGVLALSDVGFELRGGEQVAEGREAVHGRLCIVVPRGERSPVYPIHRVLRLPAGLTRAPFRRIGRLSVLPDFKIQG